MIRENLITQGAEGTEYEGSLFAIRRLREDGRHSMWQMKPDCSIRIFPLGKPYYLSPEIACNSITARNLGQFIWYIHRSALTRLVPVYMSLEGRQEVVYHIFTTLKDCGVDFTSREQLGQWVREGWVQWARTLPNPKPEWVKPYEELSEGMKEADRTMGEYLLGKLLEKGNLNGI